MKFSKQCQLYGITKNKRIFSENQDDLCTFENKIKLVI